MQALGGYQTQMMPAEDLDLWLRLAEVGRLANLDEALLRYRMHSESVSEQHQQIQRQKAREACEDTLARRGIVGTFEANDDWHPTADRRSRFRFALMYGWRAFNNGHSDAAWRYSAKSGASLLR